MGKFREPLMELISKTSSDLPKDIVEVLEKFRALEKEKSNAKVAMDIIHENIGLAKKKVQPICQDTGSILFFVKAPLGFDQMEFIKDAKDAVAKSTELGLLRQNSVDSVTGRNSGNNLGPGSPHFHFEQVSEDAVDIRLILKGGGCENVGAQYSLPDARLNAQRNIEGVKKCILDCVLQAQGQGCAPAVLGVAIGGDRTTSYVHSKEQFLRRLDDVNPDPDLMVIENEIMEKANRSGIGPMGFGGKTTIFGCKVGKFNRVPASFFVTISYMCWAFRRQGIETDTNGNIKKWIY